VTRYCDSCKLHRPLRDFDLGGGQLSSKCLACTQERSRTESQEARNQRHAEIAALEKERRALIASLVKIDARIAELRVRPSATSSAFERVEPSDVFEGAADSGVESNPDFGD
jgi:hypothetical protein